MGSCTGREVTGSGSQREGREQSLSGEEKALPRDRDKVERPLMVTATQSTPGSPSRRTTVILAPGDMGLSPSRQRTHGGRSCSFSGESENTVHHRAVDRKGQELSTRSAA